MLYVCANMEKQQMMTMMMHEHVRTALADFDRLHGSSGRRLDELCVACLDAGDSVSLRGILRAMEALYFDRVSKVSWRKGTFPIDVNALAVYAPRGPSHDPMERTILCELSKVFLHAFVRGAAPTGCRPDEILSSCPRLFLHTCAYLWTESASADVVSLFERVSECLPGVLAACGHPFDPCVDEALRAIVHADVHMDFREFDRPALASRYFLPALSGEYSRTLTDGVFWSSHLDAVSDYVRRCMMPPWFRASKDDTRQLSAWDHVRNSCVDIREHVSDHWLNHVMWNLRMVNVIRELHLGASVPQAHEVVKMAIYPAV